MRRILRSTVLVRARDEMLLCVDYCIGLSLQAGREAEGLGARRRGRLRPPEHSVLQPCFHHLLGVLRQHPQGWVTSVSLFAVPAFTCQLKALLMTLMHTGCTPTGQGLSAAAAAFLKVFAMVWAGSQVTKLPRAAG